MVYKEILINEHDICINVQNQIIKYLLENSI